MSLGTSTGSVAAAASAGPVLQIGNWDVQTLLSFPDPSTGNVKPTTTITQTPGKGYTGLTYDATGDLWGATTGGNEVVEFTASQLATGGTKAPHVVLQMTDPTGVAFDGAGNLWVTLGTPNEVVEIGAATLSTSGTPAPKVTIGSDATATKSLAFPTALTFDGSGNLWVVNTGSTSAVAYTPAQYAASGAPTPNIIIAGTKTTITGPYGVTFDASGNLWVANDSNGLVNEFTSSSLAAGGNVAPAVTITHGNTCWQLAFDTKGDLWVNYTTTDETGGYTPNQLATSGSPAPANLIKGATTTFDRPEGLAISAAPTITSVTPSSGPVGTTVTVHGSGFTSGTTVKFGAVSASTVKVLSSYTLTAKAPAANGTVAISATTWAGTSAISPADTYTYHSGYDLVGSDGGVFVFDAPGQVGGFYGSLPGIHVTPNKPVVGMVPTVTDSGYFLVAQDGGVFAFTAPFLGSLPGIHVTPAAPIVGIVAVATDKGYFLVGQDGGVFAFGPQGTVTFLGSLPGRGIHVNNIIGMAATPSGNGYWLVSATGTVYAFGAAQQNLGTAKGTPSPVSAIAGTATGGGYWITTQSGAVYAYGNAHYQGSLPGLGVTPTHPVIGIVPTAGTTAYWLLGSDGGIFTFAPPGLTVFYGSLPGVGVHVTNIVAAVPN
ncbi:MAG: IPT/TIG domain-containing protein [Acidimicrobiales bacterium]